MTAELLGPRRDHLRPVPADAVDDDVFVAVYREHFDRLRRFVLGLTGQASLAEDVAQETLLRAYTRLDRIDLERPLWPWLKRVAVRLVIDNTRCRGRESLEADPAVEAGTDTFDVTVERQLLADAMQALPVRQRVVLGLRYLENWKSAEVAAALGLSRAAVEQLLLRARRRLSAEYLALGGDSTGWRVVLWPLLFVVSRLRNRSARVRQVLNGGAAPLSMTVEGATNMVAVVAMGSMLLAGGVAIAAPAPVEVARQVEAAHASAFHAAHVRVPGGLPPAAEPPAQARLQPTRTAAAKVPTATVPAQAPQAEAAAGEVKVTKVEVAAPVEDAPAQPVAGASKERTAEAVTVRAEVEVTVGGAEGPVGGSDAFLNCSHSVSGALCGASDEAEAATPELP